MIDGPRRCPGDDCTWTTSDWALCPTHGRCAVPVETAQPLKRAPHLGWLLDDRYALLELKGIGGFGAVYRACDVKLHDQQVAVKLLLQAKPDDQARFDREMKILAGLTHPTLLAISDRGEELIGATHCVFMVGEYLPHGSLADRMRAHGALPLADAVRVVEQTAAGLACAHDAGVIHRDLKPGNLMLTAGPDAPIGIKIIDFGIAKVSDATETQGPPIGTIQYMSPEHIRGEQLTPASDVYALGIVLYEMLTGQRPFGGVPQFVEGQHIHSAPPHLPGHDTDPRMGRVDAVIQRALAKAPADRYASTLDFSAALAQAASAADPLAHTLPHPGGGRPSIGRRIAPEQSAESARQTDARAVAPVVVAEVEPTPPPRTRRLVIGLLLAMMGGAVGFALWGDPPAAPPDAAVPASSTGVAGPATEGVAPKPPDQGVPRVPDARVVATTPPDAGRPAGPKPCTAKEIEAIRAQLRRNGCRRVDVACTLADGIDPLLRRCAAARARRACQSLRAKVKAAPHGPKCRALIKSSEGKRCKVMATPGRCGYCGDGIRNGNEDCDGSKGCTKGCTHDY